MIKIAKQTKQGMKNILNDEKNRFWPVFLEIFLHFRGQKNNENEPEMPRLFSSFE